MGGSDMYRLILVPVDGSPNAERALPYALTLAKATGARLLVARVVPPSHVNASGRLGTRVKAMSDAEAYLDGLFPEPRVYPVVSTVAYFDEPARMIVQEVERRSVDLVVIATHRRAGRGAWLYGSVADRVFRHLHVPVVVLPPECSTAWDGRPRPRILVSLDGSRVAEAALRPAVDLANVLRAGLVLTRVVHPDVPRRISELNDTTALLRDRADTANASSYLEATGATLRPTGPAITARVFAGDDVSESILTVARESDVDAIALSTHGWGGFAHRLMGSIASSLVARANVPLLLVRPTTLRQSSPIDSGHTDELEAENAPHT
jgi:nucleotide-binding universal stress UspA family protein